MRSGQRCAWKAFVTAAAVMAAVCFVGARGAVAEEVAVKDGDTIAFMGDSITQYGASSPSGYVRLVISGLEANGIKCKMIGAGVSGNKSNQMLARLEKDVLSKKPTWMTLSCGVNDVWHGTKGVPLDEFKENITAIVKGCQDAGIKVMILTATMIGEDASNENNKKLAAYNDFLRELAKEKKCPLADLNADMQAARQKAGADVKRNVLTVDGVHMNPLGNVMMAKGILKAFGLSDEQLAKAEASWLDMPNACDVAVQARLTIRQYEKLDAMAAKQNTTVQALINAETRKAVDALLKDGN